MSKPRSRRDSAAKPPDRSASAIEREASEWLALREQRALTPDEQADYVAWLAADPRHRAAAEELGAAWRTFDRLADYPRPPGAPDDPNFFARPRRFSRVLSTAIAATAAAAAAIAVGWWRPETFPRFTPAVAVAEHASATTRLLRFPDGSEAELKPGSEVQEQFVPAERRVKLVRGEVHFTVAKDAARPFVVEANGVAVRAVGTAFNVRLEETAVEVLVTEGTVKVDPRPAATTAMPPAETVLRIHQRTSIPTLDRANARSPIVETLTIAEIDRALAWQTNRLIFDEMPLMDVVAQFNRVNPRRLVVQDVRLGALRISGRFRADNLDAFVELLESSFGVAAERRADGEILLRKAP